MDTVKALDIYFQTTLHNVSIDFYLFQRNDSFNLNTPLLTLLIW